MATLQEKFFSQHTRYTTVVDTGGQTGLGLGKKTSARNHYDLKSAAGSCGNIARCYVLTAQATGNLARDENCYKFTLDNTGLRKAYKKNGAVNTDACW